MTTRQTKKTTSEKTSVKKSASSVKRSPSRTSKPKSTPAPPTTLAANPFAFEVLSLASRQRTNAKKVEILEKYKDDSLRSIFVWNYDNKIQSALPAGDVPYAAADEQTSFSGTLSEKINDSVSKMEEIGTKSLGATDQGKTSIRKEYKNFYNYIRGGNDTLSGVKRENMFISLLQGLHPLEAEIMILVKDKKLQEKYKLNKDIISQAYPEIIWRN